MFDLRYHVASLAAVFLALIIGILVGAGLATRTDVEGSERRVLQDRIKELQQRNDDVVAQADLLRRQREAAENYVANTYSALMNGRLRGKRTTPSMRWSRRCRTPQVPRWSSVRRSRCPSTLSRSWTRWGHSSRD